MKTTLKTIQPANSMPYKNDHQKENKMKSFNVKSSRRAFPLVPGLIALLTCISLATSAIASSNDGAHHLTGVWDSVVTISNCQGATIRTLQALVTFHRGGTLSSTDNNSLNGPGTGTWEYLGRGSYSAPFQFFTFNPDGTQFGRTKLTRDLQLAADGMSYSSYVTVHVYDLNGNLIANLCATEVAIRVVD